MSRFRDQAGSAPIQFVLLLLPTLAMPWMTWNLIIAGYLKLTLIDAAVEGARYAALADQNLEAGRLRALQLAKLATGGLATANAVSGLKKGADGQTLVEVRIETVQPLRVEAAAAAIVEK